MKHVAYTQADRDGSWWCSSHIFPSSVHRCKDEEEADKLTKALNEAYASGCNDTRTEIREGLFGLLGVETPE